MSELRLLRAIATSTLLNPPFHFSGPPLSCASVNHDPRRSHHRKPPSPHRYLRRFAFTMLYPSPPSSLSARTKRGPLYRLTLHPSHPIRLLLLIFLIPCLVTLLGLRPVFSVWNACLVRCRSHLLVSVVGRPPTLRQTIVCAFQEIIGEFIGSRPLRVLCTHVYHENVMNYLHAGTANPRCHDEPILP